jgi:hypothetical protein
MCLLSDSGQCDNHNKTHLAIDSRSDIETYEEGHNTRDAGKSASQIDLHTLALGSSRCVGARTY